MRLHRVPCGASALTRRWSAARPSAWERTWCRRSTLLPGTSPAARRDRTLAAPRLANRHAASAELAGIGRPRRDLDPSEWVERNVELQWVDGAVHHHRGRERLDAGGPNRVN